MPHVLIKKVIKTKLIIQVCIPRLQKKMTQRGTSAKMHS